MAGLGGLVTPGCIMGGGGGPAPGVCGAEPGPELPGVWGRGERCEPVAAADELDADDVDDVAPAAEAVVVGGRAVVCSSLSPAEAPVPSSDGPST